MASRPLPQTLSVGRFEFVQFLLLQSTSSPGLLEGWREGRSRLFGTAQEAEDTRSRRFPKLVRPHKTEREHPGRRVKLFPIVARIL